MGKPNVLTAMHKTFTQRAKRNEMRGALCQMEIDKKTVIWNQIREITQSI